MRIIFVPGIKTWKFYLDGWKKDLAQHFADDERIFLDDFMYLHFEYKKLEKIIAQGVKLLDDGKPTIIIAHSFGGILAKTMIDRSKHHKVQKLITMASPHKMVLWGVRKTKTYLQTPACVDVPTQTFGGYMDSIVPFYQTGVKNAPHKTLWSFHLGFLLSSKIRNKVIQSSL